MKNCPQCGHEYYDEARWCPDCEIDLPSEAAAPPQDSEVLDALVKLARGEDPPENTAVAVARRIEDLYRSSEDANQLWRRSTERLRSVQEYELAVRFWEEWRRARKREDGR